MIVVNLLKNKDALRKNKIDFKYFLYIIAYLTTRIMTKCDYCDKESKVEWKEWDAMLCGGCAIKINRGFKKIMEK